MRDPAGVPRAGSTTDQIRRFARFPAGAALLSRLWFVRGCGLEALALTRAAALPADSFELRLLAALGLHASFLERAERRPFPGRLLAALGRARLETGDTQGALPPLLQAVGRRANRGAWLNAATALATIDPDRVAHALRGREREPLAALLLAHLALRGGAGDAARARDLARFVGGEGVDPPEADLLRADIAASEGDTSAAARARAAALARFGLPPFDAEIPPRSGDLVSVIVAAFDAEATIGAAIRSLLRQSWRTIEIILVDDASRDASIARAEAAAAGDSRLQILRMPENRGAYHARNAGLAVAAGRFVAFHDADDIAHPCRIAWQVAPLIADQRLIATTARWIRCDEMQRTRDRRILPAIRLHSGSAIVRRGFERAALNGFDPVRHGADGDFLARLAVAAGHGGIRRIAAPLTLGMVRANSAVHDPVSGYGDRGYSLERLAYREAAVRRLVATLLA